jgi:hypothetical protein
MSTEDPWDKAVQELLKPLMTRDYYGTSPFEKLVKTYLLQIGNEIAIEVVNTTPDLKPKLTAAIRDVVANVLADDTSVNEAVLKAVTVALAKYRSSEDE